MERPMGYASLRTLVTATLLALIAVVAACSKAPAPDAQGASAGAPQTASPATPVNADAQALSTMEARIKEYVALHDRLEAGLPKLKKDASPQEIDTHQRELGARVQEARKGAKPGDIFTPEAQVVVK